MCGIAGITSRTGRPLNPVALQLLTDSLSHRGPDGNGLWFNKDRDVGLGHKRLSILDTSSAGAQPMSSPDGRYVIAYNGEIYNFIEIARELKDCGYSFHTACDTEVILAAWREWGVGMLRHFNGMWAFAIYDTLSGELVLSRDRFGVKPLYYYQDREIFVFASEVQAIHRLLPDRVRPNTDFVRQNRHFHLNTHGSDATYLREVKSLIAGHNLHVNPGGVMLSIWYKAERREVARSYAEQSERFAELLVDACRIRLRSDVPVATCLSGGLDSSSIVSLLGREKSESGARFSTFSHRSFTASFPGSELDETADARAVAKSAGMDFEALTIECPTPEELETAMASCDGPMPALSFFPIWKLYQHIKRNGISVTIDGQGADETLGGYYLGYPALRGAWQKCDLRFLLDMARTYSMIHPDAKSWMANDWRRWRLITGVEVGQAIKRPLKAMCAKAGLYDLSRTKMPVPTEMPPQAGASQGPENELDTALWRQVFVAPLPFLLHQYDRCSMAHGVECRMPFMDYRLIEYLFSLPLSSRIGKGYTKRILRDSMKNIVPEKVRTNRLKVGFNAPFGDWINGRLKEWFADMVNSGSFLDNEGFDGRKILDHLKLGTPALDERECWAALHYSWWKERSAGLRAVAVNA